MTPSFHCAVRIKRSMRPSSSSTSLKKTLRPKKIERGSRARPRSASSSAKAGAAWQPSKGTKDAAAGAARATAGRNAFNTTMQVLEPDPVLKDNQDGQD